MCGPHPGLPGWHPKGVQMRGLPFCPVHAPAALCEQFRGNLNSSPQLPPRPFPRPPPGPGSALGHSLPFRSCEEKASWRVGAGGADHYSNHTLPPPGRSAGAGVRPKSPVMGIHSPNPDFGWSRCWCFSHSASVRPRAGRRSHPHFAAEQTESACKVTCWRSRREGFELARLPAS